MPGAYYYYRTAKVGQTVKFPCSLKLPYEDIEWARLATAKSRKKYIYRGNSGHGELLLDARFTVLNGRNQAHVTLVMDNVTFHDSALYQCVQNSAGSKNERVYGLTVEGTFQS